MQANDLPPQTAGYAERNTWRARLALHYTRDKDRSVLTRREHEGPLAVQKSLYPEGPGVCHNFVLHPPAGIAGGDTLDIRVQLNEGAHAVLSTPGAGKWYRSAGATAAQRLRFELAPRAILEWLPQETIIYAGAAAELHTRIELARESIYLGWEMTCLGRPASGETFDSGVLRQHTELHIDGRLHWNEQGGLQGKDPLLQSPVGLKGCSISATLLAAGRRATPDLIAALRRLSSSDCVLAVTQFDELIVLRHVGHSAQKARKGFALARRLLRPWLCGVADQALRIWQT